MQDRMREWASLKPEQRAKARDTYKDFSSLPPEQKQVMKQNGRPTPTCHKMKNSEFAKVGKSAKLLNPPVDLTKTANPEQPENTPQPVSDPQKQ